jgi:hypothetical protein
MNLLAASSEAAEPSRDKAALRNDNSLRILKLRHHRVTTVTSSCRAEMLKYSVN